MSVVISLYMDTGLYVPLTFTCLSYTRQTLVSPVRSVVLSTILPATTLMIWLNWGGVVIPWPRIDCHLPKCNGKWRKEKRKTSLPKKHEKKPKMWCPFTYLFSMRLGYVVAASIPLFLQSPCSWVLKLWLGIFFSPLNDWHPTGTINHAHQTINMKPLFFFCL